MITDNLQYEHQIFSPSQAGYMIANVGLRGKGIRGRKSYVSSLSFILERELSKQPWKQYFRVLAAYIIIVASKQQHHTGALISVHANNRLLDTSPHLISSDEKDNAKLLTKTK